MRNCVVRYQIKKTEINVILCKWAHRLFSILSQKILTILSVTVKVPESKLQIFSYAPFFLKSLANNLHWEEMNILVSRYEWRNHSFILTFCSFINPRFEEIGIIRSILYFFFKKYVSSLKKLFYPLWF